MQSMIRDADAGLKDQVGRLAYLVTGARHLKDRSLEVRIQVDGTHWYQGKAACVLFGNVPDILGGITAFADARPDDGRLEIGIVTADGLLEWTRTLGRTAVGQVERSPFVDITSGTRFVVKLDRKAAWELDGGDREPDEAPGGRDRTGRDHRLRGPPRPGMNPDRVQTRCRSCSSRVIS